MSGGETSTALLDDGRALLATFVASGWSSASILVGESQFAFSRDEPRGGFAATGAMPGSGEAPIAEQVNQVTAPHVGTVVRVAEPGAAVENGGWAASIAVLDETFDVYAPQKATVSRILVAPGTLVEFGQAILETVR